MKRLLLLVVVFAFGGILNMSTSAADVWWPGPDYPVPQKASAPAWLLTQKLNFSRWDGGPLEVCKGMLSGWPYFTDPEPCCQCQIHQHPGSDSADPASLQIGDFPGLSDRSQLLPFLHIHIFISVNDHDSALSGYCTLFLRRKTWGLYRGMAAVDRIMPSFSLLIKALVTLFLA